MAPFSVTLKKYLFVIVGTVALVIGIVGIFLPVLPTTPFLLLAALCYLRGSRRFYDALLRNRFYGIYIKNYLEGKGMSRKMKIWTLFLLWGSLVTTAILATDSLIIRVMLAAVLVGVTIHILIIKTIKL
jgi:uncharacterized membrane protein YbaN (DUF454 family)